MCWASAEGRAGSGDAHVSGAHAIASMATLVHKNTGRPILSGWPGDEPTPISSLRRTVRFTANTRRIAIRSVEVRHYASHLPAKPIIRMEDPPVPFGLGRGSRLNTVPAVHLQFQHAHTPHFTASGWRAIALGGHAPEPLSVPSRHLLGESPRLRRRRHGPCAVTIVWPKYPEIARPAFRTGGLLLSGAGRRADYPRLPAAFARNGRRLSQIRTFPVLHGG